MEENIKKLLDDIRHELVTIDNMYVTDVEKDSYVLEDLCVLPQSELIKRIDEVL